MSKMVIKSLSRKVVHTLIYSIALSLLCCSCITPTTASSIASDLLSGPADKVEVIYFHRHRRCEACTYAEERISYIIKTYFQDELTSGKLTFGIYDIEDENSSDVVKKFNAIGSQLFINKIKDGIDNIRYIEEIWYWGCIDNEEVFDSTVQDVIIKALYGD